MDSSFTGLNLPDQDGRSFSSGQVNQPVFPDFLHRQGPQGVPVSQGFPDISSSGFFSPNPMNRFPSHWSPNPLLLRPGIGPLNFSRSQRPDNTGMAAVAAAAVAAAERDGIPFPSHDSPSHTHSQSLRTHSQNIPSPSPNSPISNHSVPVPSHNAPISSQAPPVSSHISMSPQNVTNYSQNAHKLSHNPPVVSQHNSMVSQNPTTLAQNTPTLTQDALISNTNANTNHPEQKTPKGSRKGKVEKNKSSPTGPSSYRCGGCTMIFDNIDKLHDHVQCHETNGLYFFDSATNTAYPRSRSTCKVTQTDIGMTNFHPDLNELNEPQLGMDKDGNAIFQGGPRKTKLVHEMPDLSHGNETEDFVEKILSSIDGMDGEDNEGENAEGAAAEGTKKRAGRVYAKYKRRRKSLKPKKKKPKVACVQCPQCNLQFPREKKLKCDKCGKELNSETAFKHMKKCLGVKKCSFTCPQVNCGKKFSRKSSLLAHERSHTRETPFMCEICESVFTHAEKLAKHMDMHIEHRPWKCDHCPMSFKAKDHLQRHVRIHTKELPFVCHCGKAFAQNWNLITHMRVHTGEKPFKCEICGKQFAHNVSRKKHMKSHKTPVATQPQPSQG